MVEISTVNRYFGDSVLQWDWWEYGTTKPEVETGSAKSKMAASEPELIISLLVDEIETKSQRLNLHFRGQAIQWKKLRDCTTNRKWKIKDGGL